MKYETPTEIIGSPSLKLDGMENENKYFSLEICKIIFDFTSIGLSKITYFVENFGLKAVLDNPALMGITEDQEKTLHDLTSCDKKSPTS